LQCTSKELHIEVVNIWIARQPIFNRNQQVHAYELLFRHGDDCNFFDGTDAASATTEVIAHTLLSIGLDNLIGTRKAFVNLDRRLLLDGFYSILPADKFVIEILEQVQADPEVRQACRNLRDHGYTIALDDYTSCPETEPLTEFAEIIKIDMRNTPRGEQKRMLAIYREQGIAMLAEKVETNEEFVWALEAGYDFFQGFFFARPAVVPGRQIPPGKAASLRLLCEARKPDLDYSSVEGLIAGDVALTWQLLRYVNSVLFYRGAEIRSISQALAILGEENIRRWAALSALPRLAKNKPEEIITLSLVRAHFGEFLARLAGLRDAGEAFLMGLLSLIDTLLEIPLEDALDRTGLSERLRSVLLDRAPGDDPLRAVYQLLRAWETGNLQAVSSLAIQLGVSQAALSQAYAESTLWADRALQGLAYRMHSRRQWRRTDSESVQMRWKEGRGFRSVRATILNRSDGGLAVLANEHLPLKTTVFLDPMDSGLPRSGTVRHSSEFNHDQSLIGIEYEIHPAS
jgi:EAL and modified HD-GYP domain-containing signal transduction protein